MSLLELNRRGSDFVNITAWLTMALALMWFVMSLVYLGLFTLLVPQADLNDFVGQLVREGMLPLSIPWFLDHIVQYFVSAIVFAPVLFYGALDLLRRREWARIFMMTMIALSVVANLLPIIALVAWPEWLFPPIALAEESLLPTRYMMVFLVLVLSGLLAAMAWKFRSAEIRAEFQR